MVKIGLLGLGTVGSGVYEILTKKIYKVEKSTNSNIEISKILVKNLYKNRGFTVDSTILTNNPDDILENPEIDIVVEVMGGMDPAYDYIVKALENGKHVVTANKEILANHLFDLNNIAKKANKGILFEASVAGGIPIIKSLKEMIKLNHITEIKGILNGTANFILSKMTEEGMDFNEALKTAQCLGYAEFDPTDDIEGYDTARKLAILSSIAFDYKVSLDNVECRGISSISALDISFFNKLDLTVKLVGSSKAVGDNIYITTEPVLLENHSVMSKVNDAFNIVSLTGDSVGNLQFYGQGAGKAPTANAVVSDIIDIINGDFSYILENKEKTMKFIKTSENYYLRLSLENIEEAEGFLQEMELDKVKYNILNKNANLILVLEGVKVEYVKMLLKKHKLENKSCYIKIDGLQGNIIKSIKLKDIDRLAI